MASTDSSTTALATQLAQYTIHPNHIQETQLAHRINLLRTWLPESSLATSRTPAPRILEIGCGQGDMTVVLAHAIQHTRGHIDALDPAPLSYGSPFTLGESQAAISQSPVGAKIHWIQRDPLDYLSDLLASSSPAAAAAAGAQRSYDYIVLAHSLFYLPNEAYFRTLLHRLHDFALLRHSSATTRAGTHTTTLLLAEWGMRATTGDDASSSYAAAAAAAHLHAVRAQAAFPVPEGNVRTVLEPARIRELAAETGWTLQQGPGAWLRNPEVDDGRWEVEMARTRLLEAAAAAGGREEEKLEARQWLRRIDEAVARATAEEEEGRAAPRSMDVWTAVFRCA